VRHIDFHLTLPGSMTVEESHAVADRVEAALEELYPSSVVTIHVEPETEVPRNAGL
jgi:divalent metal cation (Fe/Co/Zn/Cd) transporter